MYIIGRPPPKVTWWREDVEISTMSHPSTNEGVPAIVNQLFISNITRDFFGTKLECRAQGSKLMSAVSKEVTIEIHRKFFTYIQKEISIFLFAT